MTARALMHDLDITDLFCGAGGSGIGAAAAGYTLVMAANHWTRAIETHAANFPDTEHDCADISQVNPRRYRRTRVLWASPECTNHTIAKGKKRQTNQPDLFGETLPDAAAERSRATMWDVPRFAEVHAYDAVVVENVVDAAKWVMFSAWLSAMHALGYEHQIVYLNSMHAQSINTPRAPQSRDRMYVVFHRVGAKAPVLDVRPPAYCIECESEVEAVQWWKKPDYRWGKYRAQYLFRCPNSACNFRVVEPYVLPAASAIDWTMPGKRIGDRDKPLSDKTRARIGAGLTKLGRAMTFEAQGNTYVRPGSDYARAWPVDQPTATLTTSETRALIVPVEGREGKQAVPVSEPIRTITTRAETALVVPYYGTQKAARSAADPLPTMGTVDTAGVAFIAELRGGGSTARDVSKPLSTVTASGNHHMLVRHNSSRGPGGEMCTPASEPMRTLTTAGHQSLVSIEQRIDNCTFRMLEPTEIQAAMAFYARYRVLGTRRERVKQLGNGVTPPAPEWLLRSVAESLESAA